MANPPKRAESRRYDRVASVYDTYSAPMEWAGGRERRQRILSRAAGRVLEVGIGTGANLDQYPPGVELVGIDVSRRMLARAARRVERLGKAVTLELADVERLPFDADSFDTAVATCVFCSVADPVAGLRELGRVTKPAGRILLLEHVRPEGILLGLLADLVSPAIRSVCGPNLNRRTEENVAAAGLRTLELGKKGVWREIVAAPSGPSPPVAGVGDAADVADAAGRHVLHTPARPPFRPSRGEGPS